MVTHTGSALSSLIDEETAVSQAKQRQSLLKAGSSKGPKLVVLDVPLLFETNGGRRCDRVAVVSCAAFLQAQRVLARPGMTEERLAAIRAKQMPDAAKRRRADFVIPTGMGKPLALRRLKAAVRVMKSGA